MLTTKDNPYNPHTDFESWMNWDIDNGYNTMNYLARMANLPDNDDDEELMEELTRLAMIDIVENSPIGQWIIVEKG